MASLNKMNKLENSYGVASILKNKMHVNGRLKRGLFYTASDRQIMKAETRKEALAYNPWDDIDDDEFEDFDF